jgi:hypothetical protein
LTGCLQSASSGTYRSNAAAFRSSYQTQTIDECMQALLGGQKVVGGVVGLE